MSGGRKISKPKVLVLSSTYPRWMGDHEPGFVHELSRRLVSRFDVTVLCPSTPGAKRTEVMNGVHVIRYRYAPRRLETLVAGGGIIGNIKTRRWKIILLPFFMIAQIFSLFFVLRSVKPDVIHAHWIIPQGFAVILLRKIGVFRAPVLITSHGADLFSLRGRIFSWVKRFVTRSDAKWTVVSSMMKEHLGRLGVDESKIEVRSMGVDIEENFKINPEKMRSKSEILFVGRLVEKKGLSFLIRALPIIRECFPDAHMTIVGYGPEESTLRALAEDLNLTGCVTFIGGVSHSELPNFYQRAAIFVSPFIQAKSGDQEGLGLVSIEALSCGCPVVSTKIPAVDDLSSICRGMLVVPPQDSLALAEAIKTVLRSPREFQDLALGDSLTVRNSFGWPKVAERYAAILEAEL